MTSSSSVSSVRSASQVSRAALAWSVARFVLGVLMVGSLGYALSLSGDEFGWLSRLFVWVLVTILADELGGWFGYLALAAGVLPLVLGLPIAQWAVLFPLIGGALFATLLIKHSGGALVLPFAGALFAATLLGVDFIGDKLDPSLSLVHNKSMQQTALVAMVVGLGFSFVRQLGVYLWNAVSDYRARRTVVTRKTAAVPVLDLQLDTQTEPQKQESSTSNEQSKDHSKK